MKAGREWRVPITPLAAATLPSERPRIPDGYVFPNREGGRLSDMALTMLLRKRGASWVPHGIRAAFKSWATEQGHAHQAVELCLAHTPSKLERAYQRSDLLDARRELLLAWAAALGQA
jgi:integrase